MSIDKVNGVLWSSIVKVTGVVKANIAKVGGASVGDGITFDDITHSCFPNPTWTNTTPLSFTLPSTAVVDDLLFIFVNSDGFYGSDYITTPSGWNKTFGWYGTTSDNTGHLFWKIADATDISNGVVDIYAAISNYNRNGQGWSWIANGVDTTTPISDVGVWTQSSGISKTIAGITPSDNGVALGFWGYDGGDGEPTTITSGWTKLEEEDCNPGSAGVFAGFASLQTTSGVATGNLVVTALLSDGWGGVIVNFRES